MKRPIIGFACTALLAACLPLSAQSRRYALVLEDPPVTAKIGSRSQLRSQIALDAASRIEVAQSSVRRELAARKIRVTGSAHTLLNAIFVEAARAKELQGLPGVRYVAPLHRMKPHLDHALPLVNASQAWSALASAGFPNAGAGVKIGILDTGIDQTHPAFQDSSLQPPPDRPACNDFPGHAGNNDCAYTNSKVIVARSYVSMFAADNAFYDPAFSRPDDYSPRDRSGHGTAAAMAAAGVSHSSPLATISGVAPKAYLGNYKIYGSPGLNGYTTGDAVTVALEDALADGMDVVSLTTGFLPEYTLDDPGDVCGGAASDTCDVEALAVENAVQAGLTVVVSAGNDGEAGLKSPTLNTINTPGTAPSAITVGASRNSHVLYSKVGLTAGDAPSNLRNLHATYGDALKISVTAPLRDVANLGNDGLACSALAGGSLNGAIALVRRDRNQCDFATKIRNAKNAGAVGVVIYREDGAGAAGDIPIPPLGVAGTGIPAAMVGNTDGHNLKTYLQSHADAAAIMDPALVAYDDATVNTVASFSSRGPSIANSAIKPDLVAPGTGIYTATEKYDTNGELYNSSGYTVMEGTSVSAPIVAGAVALVVQKNPSFSPARLKSAVVNTASHDVMDGGATASVVAAGAGRLNAQAAVQTNVTVYPASISYGVVTPDVIGSQRGSISLTVYNGSSSQLTLSVDPITSDSHAHLTLSKTTVAAGPNLTDTVVINLAGTMPDPGSYEGAITIRGGAVDLRVPFLYLAGDGIPFNLFATTNGSFEGLINDQLPFGGVWMRAIDRFGAPVIGAPVSWRSTQGGGTVSTVNFDNATRKYGLAGSWAYFGPSAGNQVFTATVGNPGNQFVLPFSGLARVRPTIDAGGVINAASGVAPTAGGGLAPGSYISIYGQNLSDNSVGFDLLLPSGINPYLPVSLGGTWVSFDVATRNLSVPGHLSYAGPRQVNVQIPWELAGSSSAQMKVTLGDFSTALYTVPIADAAPGVFEYPIGSGNAVAQDPFTGRLFTQQAPPARDQWITLYVNGLGPVDTTPASGDMTPAQGLARCTKTVTVTIGGKNATVDFAGLTPTGIGYYQINLKVPSDAPSGLQPVLVTANGVPAKTVNLTIQ